MAEPAPSASPESETSLESIRAFDRSKVKCGPGALAPSATDPLRHEDYDYFWSEIDKYFYPITTSDAGFLRGIPVNPFGAYGDEALRLPVTVPSKDGKSGGAGPSSAKNSPWPAAKENGGRRDKSDVNGGLVKNLPSGKGPVPASLTSLPCDQSVLNSYPLTQRLVAALIDEGGGGMPSSAPQRPARGAAADIDHFWPGIGTEPELRVYQKALDVRVGIELKEAGLLGKADAGDELQASMRHDQWKLRDLKTSNRARKSSLYTLVIGTELRRQAFQREHKKHMDETEIAYLERMIKKLKKNKKARNKYPKLLQKMFKNYKQRSKPATIAAPPPPAGLGAGGSSGGVASTTGGASSSVHGARGSHAIGSAVEDRLPPKSKSAKKKKKRSESSRPPASKSAANKGKQHMVDDSDTM